MQNFHQLIDSNRSHPHYGRLLQHRDRNNPNTFHYSVQLNDLDSLAWEPMNADRQKDTGRLAIWSIDWNRFQIDQAQHQQKEQINKALHVSVKEFHKTGITSYVVLIANIGRDLYQQAIVDATRLPSSKSCKRFLFWDSLL
ncbi:MAG: hypothetical protein KME01_13025 [Chroococcus sp. CMT-3BRIN-NPC107]|jgi:hypothetical protein|nr:hypothetical protein [Chroococcus sp. CMT-3BRIN-NPC107]